MYSEIVSEPQFYLDNDGFFFPEATSFILIGEKLEYLYKLFHSNPITYFFKTFYAGGGLGESGYRYKKAFLINLPIPKWKGTEIQQKIESISNDDIEIDNLVSVLYGLTDEEIAFIESR